MNPYTKWGVYCTAGHACIGAFDTELEALDTAIQMTQTGGAGCVYDSIPLFIIDNAPNAPEDGHTGHYL